MSDDDIVTKKMPDEMNDTAKKGFLTAKNAVFTAAEQAVFQDYMERLLKQTEAMPDRNKPMAYTKGIHELTLNSIHVVGMLTLRAAVHETNFQSARLGDIMLAALQELVVKHEEAIKAELAEKLAMLEQRMMIFEARLGRE